MNWRTFEHYVNQIENQDIKIFTIQCLEKADPILEKIPASSTGKYHHKDNNGEGGLVRHIERACYFANIFFEAYNWLDSKLQKDVLISVLLLHDIGKKEHYRNYQEYTNHSLTACEIIKPFKNIVKNDVVFDTINNCILHHMGPFTPSAYRKPMEQYTQLELLTYFCDYFSARKEINLGN